MEGEWYENVRIISTFLCYHLLSVANTWLLIYLSNLCMYRIPFFFLCWRNWIVVFRKLLWSPDPHFFRTISVQILIDRHDHDCRWWWISHRFRLLHNIWYKQSSLVWITTVRSLLTAQITIISFWGNCEGWTDSYIYCWKKAKFRTENELLNTKPT